MVKVNLIKRKLKNDLQRYVFKAIPQGFSSIKYSSKKRFTGKGTFSTSKELVINENYVSSMSATVDILDRWQQV